MKVILLITFLISFDIGGEKVSGDPSKRNIDNSLQLISELDLYKIDIFRPSLMSMDNDNNIAIFDYNHKKIIYFNLEDPGEIKFFGKGVGGGPEEFRNPTDIKFDQEGKIWLVDPQLAKISIWSTDGELISTFNHDRLIPEDIAINDRTYLIRSREYSSKHGIFHLYNLKNKKIKSFGKLNAELTSSSFAFEGEIEADRKSFYFTGMNSGFIKKYSSEGFEIFSVKTIDPIPTAKLVTKTMDVGRFKNVKVTKLDDEAKSAAFDIDIDHKYVYVLFSGEIDKAPRFIDIYDKYNGEYIKSYKLNNACWHAKINNNNIYTVEYNSILGRFMLRKYLISNE